MTAVAPAAWRIAAGISAHVIVGRPVRRDRRDLPREIEPLSDLDGLQARFLCCLALSNAAANRANAKDAPPSRTIAEAVGWLERNYASRVHMDRLVEHIGYSRARFFALFREQTNMTPSEYLRNYRLEKAKEMLLATDLPAVQVGKACGLGAPAHFSRLFSKMTGHTPLDYRRLKRDS